MLAITIGTVGEAVSNQLLTFQNAGNSVVTVNSDAHVKFVDAKVAHENHANVSDISEESLAKVGMVIVDFESMVKSSADHKNLFEVASFVRKYAANYESVVVITNLADASNHVGSVDFTLYERRILASKAFSLTAKVDTRASEALSAPEKIVLIVGSGGREHAIAHKMSQSNHVDKVLVAPGNGGTAHAGGKISNLAISASDNAGLVQFAKSNGVSLVVVGPEQPLVDGLSDDMKKAGVPCFGPSALAAAIEASKAWSKDFMSRHNIRTARYRNFTNFEEAKSYIESLDYKVVIKASGLAAGKGVLLPNSIKEAVDGAREIMVDKCFGDAGGEVVVEEFLEGEELSLLSFCDGNTVVAMPGAQDHKRVFDNDQGPNTGGMGAYAPAPLLTPQLKDACMPIIEATVKGMAAEGRPYQGVLYTGFIITKDGPAVLEYNCRFGDPEAQVLLPLLESDLYSVMQACVSGNLDKTPVSWLNSYACTVICAAPGYPNKYPTGSVISGLDDAKLCNKAYVYHAGTKCASPEGGNDNKILTSGGRVLAVTGVGATLSAAVRHSYECVSKISFQGMHYRKDIAHRGLKAPLRVGVLGSIRGTAMRAVIEAIDNGSLNATIVLVVSNKKDAGILEQATGKGIQSVYISSVGKTREEYDAQVTEALSKAGVQLVLMIGYMRIVSEAFTQRWENRCLNVHPSLLPDFAGGMDLQVHTAVIEAGRTKSGCTVHFVTAQVDGGPIVVQKECPVVAGETPESLKVKVQALEGASFIEAIDMFHKGLVGPDAKEVITYRHAGVDIDAGEALVDAIKPYCKATRRPGCDAELGGFGGLFDLSQAGYNANETILVSGTDGVGTKLKIAQTVGKHDTIGIDLVAMCVNDILVCGAEPLFFLDYYATGALNVTEAAQVVKGIAEGCSQSGSALIGGETAEMAGMYAKGEYDLAGFSVGAVRRQDILPKNICAGDALIGLRSSGVHSNGYSLVRRLVAKSGLDWNAPAPFQPSSTLGDALLTPTRIYVKLLMPLVKAGLIKGMAHITGGGLLDNLPRILPDDVEAAVDIRKSGWTMPPVFHWLQSYANLPQSELLRTFNCGVGMVLAVDPSKLDAVMAHLTEAGEEGPLLLGALQPRVAHDSPQVVVSGTLA